MLRLLISCLVLGPAVLSGQNSVEPLIELFEQKKYPETLRLAEVKRNSARAGELASIDLIIACSYCLGDEDPRRGKAVLDKITNNYRLNRKQERSVQQIRAVCGTPSASVRLPELDVVQAVRDMGQVAVRGGSAKSGWEITLDDRFRTVELDTSATPPPPTHAASFSLAQKEAAAAYYASLYADENARRTLSEYFLIYSLSRVSRNDLRALGIRLDQLLTAYAEAYASGHDPDVAAGLRLPVSYRRFAIWLRPDGTYRPIEYTDRSDINVFRAAVAVWNWKDSNK